MRRKIASLIFTLSALIQNPVLVTGRDEFLQISPIAPVVRIGEAVELRCVALCPSGNPEWKQTIDSTPGKVTSSASNSVLRIDKVLETYENTYKCVVRCDGRYFQKRVFLSVYSFPHNPLVKLQSLNPVSGQTVTLECLGRDLYPCYKISVLWYLNLELLKCEKQTPIWNHPLCNVASQLNYTTNSRNRDLTFTCEIQLGLNSEGLRSRNSSLEMHLDIRLYNIQIEPTHTVQQAGNSLSISCSGGGDPVPEITWRKPDSGSRTPPHWNITRRTGHSTLYINELEPQDGGVYICEVSNGKSSTERQSSVDVWYGPRDVFIDGGGNARENEALALTCRGHANPEPNITWARTTHSQQQRWNISNSRGRSELRIDSLRPEDQGIYECLVENKLGDVRLKAQVDVEYGPRDVFIDGGGNARENEALALTCRGHANPESNITWARTTHSQQQRWNISNSRGRSELRIDSLRPEDQGIYECLVENKLGDVRLKAQVNVFVTVKPEQKAIVLGLSVPLASLSGFGFMIYLIRKILLKELMKRKPLRPEGSTSKGPVSHSQVLAEMALRTPDNGAGSGDHREVLQTTQVNW
ncbi:hemicentin-2-like isoform X1 [Carcharodon carcharias]|uniref:hemicentin-2-like isoform X1 n=1 Tax=Carcharodon carcharias TaxID=13397 RepID=UPI001B7F5EE0|nr:hemicentin-2-like isoform X1 [Carcharodon carcharias]